MADDKKVFGKIIGIICLTIGIMTILVSIIAAVYTGLAVGIGSGVTGLFCLFMGLFLLNAAKKNSKIQKTD